MRVPLVIYHGNCADGFTAAWACWKKHPEFEYVPGHYGKPRVTDEQARDRDLILLDFCYKRDQLLELAKVARHIIILDHHKSAMAALDGLREECAEKGLAPVMATFDMDRSGAGIAWEFFHGAHCPPPALVRFVQDRDLWRFELEGTREYQAAVFSYDYDFDTWDRLSKRDPAAVIREGEAILRKHMKDVRELIAGNAGPRVIAGHTVPTLNAPYFYSSEAGHIMAENQPFAACWWDSLEGGRVTRKFSLRSSDGAVDVSEIAVRFGGGGHRNAAGFEVDLQALGDVCPWEFVGRGGAE